MDTVHVGDFFSSKFPTSKNDHPVFPTEGAPEVAVGVGVYVRVVLACASVSAVFAPDRWSGP